MKKEALNLYLWKTALISVLDNIIERYNKHPDYHFIDTKLDIITGQDFPDSNVLFGRQTIFSWIQGRGLEALAGHYHWICKDSSNDTEFKEKYSKQIKEILREVLLNTDRIYVANGGHMPFMIDVDDQPLHPAGGDDVEHFELCVSADSMTLSDLFYIKGMAASSAVLGMDELYEKAEIDFDRVIKSLFDNKFIFDQLSFDVKNQIAKQSDGILQGGFMIALGGCPTFMNRSSNKDKYYRYAVKLIDHILANYVNIDEKISGLKQYEMWELSDCTGSPVLEDGVLKSDPGHALEFVGLAFKALYTAKKNNLIEEIPQRYIDVLSEILIVNFENGFSKDGYGIVKSFDLYSHKVINSDMPWWSLPETMRSCALAFELTHDKIFIEKMEKCNYAFVSYYLKPERNYMAIQTVNDKGQPVGVIPATPDADPAYHTGLSMIDVIGLQSKL